MKRNTTISPHGKWIGLFILVIIAIVFVFLIVMNQNEKRIDDLVSRTITNMNTEMSYEINKATPTEVQPTPTVRDRNIPLEIELIDAEEGSDEEWSFLGFDEETSPPKIEETKTPESNGSEALPTQSTGENTREDGTIETNVEDSPENTPTPTEAADPVNEYEERRKKKLDDYLKNLDQMGKLLDKAGSRCDAVTNQYVEAYNHAAMQYNRGFADAIAKEKSQFKKNGTFQIIDIERRELKEFLIKISTPPSELAELYPFYKKMFQVYEKYYYLCISPPDSMSLFQEQLDAADQQYNELRNRIDLYLQKNKSSLQ